jgi:hypothetical protein
MRLDGTPLRTLYQYEGRARVTFDAAWKHAIADAGWIDLTTGRTRPITHAQDYSPRLFRDATTMVASRAVGEEDVPWKRKVDIRELTTDSLVVSFTGFAPAVEDDGSVLFLQVPAPKKKAGEENEMPAYVDIARWTRRGIAQLKRIELSEEGGPYAVTDVVPLPNGGYAYRVYDEHEYRYFDASGRPFFPGLGHFIDSDSGRVSKEQNSLVASRDGKLAAYTERSWNQLTYLVVVDLKSGRRIQTPYYGSFPRIYGNRVLFVSDPSFVLGGNDLSFRQIKKFALYAYDVPSGSLCLIATMPTPALIEQ